MNNPEQIDLIRLTEIFGVDKPNEFWFVDDCEIEEHGIRPKPVDQNAMKLLCGDEWREVQRFRQDICLTLPCSFKEVIAWSERNGFADALRDDFLESTQENAVTELQGEQAKTSAVGGVSQSRGEFDKRLRSLKDWMDSKGFQEGEILPKHYTIKKVYNELCAFNGNLFCSCELSTFKRHFWSKQKLCKLTRGRKDGVV